jgi:tetratricopeptide (TPR) repeat protein
LTSLNNLALVLSKRFDKTGQLADLEEAIVLNREALELLPPPNPDRSISLNNLALVLSKRFDKTGQLADLEEAIHLRHEVFELLPPTNLLDNRKI